MKMHIAKFEKIKSLKNVYKKNKFSFCFTLVYTVWWYAIEKNNQFHKCPIQVHGFIFWNVN